MQSESYFKKILSFVLPAECVICNRMVKPGEVICRSCEEKIFNLRQHGRLKLKDLYVYYYGCYGGDLKKVILSFKSGRWRLKGLISDIYVKLFEIYKPHDASHVTFIPSTPSSMEIRGYDHMRIIAKEVAKKAGLKFIDSLSVVKDWHQAVRNLKERKKLTGKFSAKKIPRIKSIVLLDDVITSGKTLENAAEALRDAGIKDVFLYVISKVCG